VKSHVNHIYSKLGVTSRSQAIARAHALHIG
jgi:ATP/maltotriose-dependent transcriptional regulator MalT